MTRLRRILGIAAATACLSLASAFATAQPALVVKPLAEKRVTELPSGDLFWRIETVESRPQAETLAGPWSLVADAAGKTWLFTLGAAGASTPGATQVAEVGPFAARSHQPLRISHGLFIGPYEPPSPIADSLPLNLLLKLGDVNEAIGNMYLARPKPNDRPEKAVFVG
jgi:hypothetical protein